MRKFITLLFFLFTGIIAMAQNSGILNGKLIDSVGKQSLKDASISVLDPKDSTLEVFGLSLADGTFSVKNITFGTYLIHISFQSYESIFKHITISQTNSTINLGNIYLKIESDLLPGVTVTMAPIVIKKDTIEYNASSFKTKPNAVAEDLLKKMPGIDVDKSGNITAQGESVKRVLVDGKRFFGDDPKMATRNLPPDVIDKVQVFDDLSDQSKFTGFDDGNRVKTINLTTRKDKRKGYFGKAVVSDGTDGKYDESANIHRFNGSQQISLIGQSNDVNKQNFNGGGNGGSGITTTTAAGANYRDSWGKTNTTDLSGSYFYNNLSTLTKRQNNSQYLPQSDTSNISNSNSNSVSKNQNHRLNFNLESKLDSVNSLVFRPGISFTHSTPNSSSQTLLTHTNGDTLTNSANTTHSINDGFSINGTNFQIRHRFNKKYRTISLDINYSASQSQGDGYNYAINNYKKINRIDTLDQYFTDTSRSYSISPTLSYTEPLGKNSIFEIRYNFSYSNNSNLNNTFRFTNADHNYKYLDSLFTNSYKFNSTSNNFTLSYRLQKTNYNFNIGSGIQYTDRSNLNTTKNINTPQHFINLTPTANFHYTFTKTSNLRIFYSGRTGQPSITQLQPLTTTSDSLNFQVGNPLLKQQFTHSLRALYTNFDVVTQKVIFATLNFSTTVNDIQNSVFINSTTGGTTTHYVNLNGTYNLSGYFNYGFPLRKPKSNLSFATNINYSQAQSLIDGASNYTRNTSLGENIKWTTNLKDNFDMNFSANSTYNIARYTLRSTSNANYYSLGLSTDFTYYTNNGWLAAADFDYTYSGNHAAGYNTSIPLLNPSIAKQFLKNKAGELRLTCFDLLNANKSVTRSVSSTQITDTRTNVLTQYFLLTFTYNLRRFPGAGANAKGQGPMRGMRGDGGGDRGGGGFGGGGRRE